MDFIESDQGTLLSHVWPRRRHDGEQRQNFLRSLSKVILNLARPLSVIGSFTIDNHGNLSPSRRPLTLQLLVLENKGIPTQISPDTCYSNNRLIQA